MNTSILLFCLQINCLPRLPMLGQWIGKLADYYEYYLYTKKEQLYVMAQIDYMPAIQQYTDYPVENDTIICLSVTQN